MKASSPPSWESAPITAADISIVVPVGGGAPAWPQSARSLARLDPPPGEILVVIDGPYERHEDPAKGIGARILRRQERGGPAVARNLGAREARGRVLFFLDSDIEVPTDLLAKLSEVLNAHPEATAVIGSYDDAPGHRSFLSQYRNLLHHYVHQVGRDVASTFWSGCGAVYRKAFEDVGGFDENYPVPSIEDIELGARLRRAGHTIRLAKDFQVKHLKEWRLGDMLKTDLLRRAVPWTELMLREGEIVNDLNVKTRDRASVVFAFLVPLGALGAGFWWPALSIGIAAITGIVFLNAGFFNFLRKKRGPLFAAKALPFYWIYLVICGLGFGMGMLRWVTRGKKIAVAKS